MDRFVIPYKHEDLRNEPMDDDRFWVENPPEVNTEADARKLANELKDLKKPLAHAEGGTAQKWFGLIDSGRASSHTTKAIEVALMKLRNLSKEKKDEAKQRQLSAAFKFVVFFACWQLQKLQSNLESEKLEQKKAPKEKDPDKKGVKAADDDKKRIETEAARRVMLDSIVDLLEDPHGLHVAHGVLPDEDLLLHLIQTAIFFVEKQDRAKVRDVRMLAAKMVSAVITNFQNPNLLPMTAANVIRLVSANDWAGLYMAEMVCPTQDTTLARAVLTDLIQSMAAAAKQCNGMKVVDGARNPPTFVVELTRRAPALMMRSITMLLPFHNYDAYPLRSMLAEIISTLLVAEKDVEDEEMGDADAQNKTAPLVDMQTRAQLLDILESRVLDKMSYTRAKVLQAWLGVASCKWGIPRDRWKRSLEIVLGRLDDNSSSVRKSAMHCLNVMVDQHPYGELDNPRDVKHKEEIQARLEDLEKIEELSEENEAEYVKYKAGIQALESRMKFAELVFGCTGQLVRLLGSKTPTDAVQAANTIVSLRETGLLPGEWPQALSDTFALVWSGDETVQKAAVEAFTALYVNDKSGDQAAKGLVELLQCPLTHGDLSSITEIMKCIVKEKFNTVPLPSGLVALLVHNDEPEALAALAMISTSKDMVMHTAALIYRAKDADFKSIANIAMIAQTTKYQPLVNECVERITAKGSSNIDGTWFEAARRTMDAQFAIAQERLDDKDRTLQECTRDSPLDFWGHVVVEMQGERLVDLVRTMFLMGHLAVKGLIWCDAVRAVLKRRRMETESTADDLDLGVGVAKDEAESEAFAIMEESLVNRNMYNQLKPTIIQVAKDPKIRQECPTLAHVATIALCKYMVVSKEFCKKNLQLLFTLLFPTDTKSTIDTVEGDTTADAANFLRSDLTIACGDLLWRHPNVVEPWNAKLFATLSDPMESTRFAGATVLTNLTLGDMVKAKGPLVFAMMRCTKDSSVRVSRLARIFFRELNKKPGHIIYNCIPDLLSRLTSEEGIPEDEAHEHVQYLLNFIGRDKHVEQLVDKLCARIQQADKLGSGPVNLLSSALPQLNWTEKCFAKLAECWSRDLHHILSFHEGLRKNLKKVFLKMKRLEGKQMKPEVKVQMEMLEAKLREADGEAEEGEGGLDAKVDAVAEDLAGASVQSPAKGGGDDLNPPSPAPPAKRRADGPAVVASPPAKLARGSPSPMKASPGPAEPAEPAEPVPAAAPAKGAKAAGKAPKADAAIDKGKAKAKAKSRTKPK